MIPGLVEIRPVVRAPSDGEFRVLIAARHATQREAIAGRLMDAGFQVTVVRTFGIAEVLTEAREAFDLMVIIQSAEETTMVTMPQLVRSIDADLPLVVLEGETADAPTVVDVAWQAMARWPVRGRSPLSVH